MGAQRQVAAVLALLVIAPFVATTASATVPQTFSYNVALGPDQFVAVRLNFSGVNDLRYDRTLWACTGPGPGTRGLIGHAVWGIYDGHPSAGALEIGDNRWSVLNGASLQANAAGKQFFTADREAANRCTGTGEDNPLSHGVNANQTQATLVYLAMATEGSFWFNASWTKGLVSWDIYVGNATVLTMDQFPTGVHATVVPLGPAAGAMQSYHFVPTGNSVGYFAPDFFTSGKTVWSCTHNGVDCPPGDFGAPPGNVKDVYSSAGDSWWFNVTAKANANPPMYVLGLCEFPDSSYLW